jgi:hypothetical protein
MAREILGISGISSYKGRLDSWQHVHKFGSNPSIATAEESIWSGGGLYPWPTGAVTLIIQSDDTGDAGTVEIQGLDGNYNELTETVTLPGGSPNTVTTANTFLRVYRMRFTGAADNAGTIIANHTATNIAQIDPGRNQTLMAVYTVPAGSYAWLLNYTVSVGKNDDALVELYTRKQGELFRIQSEVGVYQSSFTKKFPVPLKLAPKTDIDFRAITTNSGSGHKVIATFDIIYE